MKLNQIGSSNFVKCLVYGDSGTGKTCFAVSFPGPIKFWDFDNKVNSAANFFRTRPEKLSEVDVVQFAQMARTTRMREFQREFNDVIMLAAKGQPLPFKTLVLDSLTTFVNYTLDDYIYVSQTGIKRPIDGVNAMQDYQLLDRHLTQMIAGILSLNCNVVVTGHLGIDKDETTGQIIRRVLMSGKFADKLPIYFEEVYVSKLNAKGEFVLQTQTDAFFKCRTQRQLPKEIPTDYGFIIKERGIL